MTEPGDTAARDVPVLLERVVELLGPALEQQGAVCVDATLGMGGHAEALLTRCPAARVIGLDRDTEALALARTRLARFGDVLVIKPNSHLVMALPMELVTRRDYELLMAKVHDRPGRLASTR